MRVSGMQSPQCRFQGTVVSVIIVFVLVIFVFVLVFVNENHTELTAHVSDLSAPISTSKLTAAEKLKPTDVTYKLTVAVTWVDHWTPVIYSTCEFGVATFILILSAD